MSRTRARSRIAYHLQKFVADWMAERVVDVLEVVKVQNVYGHHLSARRTRQRLLQPLIQQRAIGQRGQRIVQRHVRDLGLRATLLGDVLVRGDYAAVDHRLYRDRNEAPVGQLADVVTCTAGWWHE